MSVHRDSQAITAAVSELDPHQVLELNTSRSPEATETLGTELAVALRPYQPSALVIWSSTDNAVLAHVAARELHVEVVASYKDLGRLSLDRDLPPQAAVALIGGIWRTPRELSALQALVQNQGASVAVAAAVVETESLRAAGASGLSTISLIGSPPTPSSRPRS